jgi:hypothetical protein
MYPAYAVVAVVLALGLVASGALKLAKQPTIVEGIGGLGVPLRLFPVLAALEIAGALGLVAGLWIPALGIAAATGVVLYFVGAVTTHLRAHNRALASPAVVGLLAGAALVLRILSL